MNADLFKAILAMDAYNRGYNAGIKGFSDDPKLDIYIGNAKVIDSSTRDAAFEKTGFYAIAYQIGGVLGEAVISYRGTDDLQIWSSASDIWNGWGVGKGSPEGDQADLAFTFFNTVKNILVTPSNISLTGHSLGGGLAGLVGAVNGLKSTIFDNMPYQDAALKTHEYALNAYEGKNPFNNDEYDEIEYLEYKRISNHIWQNVYQGRLPTGPISVAGSNAYYVDGEFLALTRGGQSLQPTPLDLGPNVDLNGLDKIARHKISLLVIRMFADGNFSNGQAVGTNWRNAAAYFLPQLYDDKIASAVGVESIQGSSSPSDVMRDAIAYSAIDEGTNDARPFGDTGIQALYDDANELGQVLGANPRFGFAKAITKVFVQFAGQLAINKVLKSSNGNALHGVLALSGSPQLLTVNFADNLWTMPQSSPPQDIVGREELLSQILNAAKLTLKDVTHTQMTIADYAKSVEDIVFATTNEKLDRELVRVDEGKTNIFVAGGGDDRLTSVEGDDFILGCGGNDTFYGSAGNDTLCGGNETDIVNYGLLKAGITVRGTTLQKDSETDIFAREKAHTVDKKSGGTDLVLAEKIVGTNYDDTFYASSVISTKGDYFVGNGGNDTFDLSGGNGRDTVEIATQTGSSFTATINGYQAGDDIIIDGQHLTGCSQDPLGHYFLGSLTLYPRSDGIDVMTATGSKIKINSPVNESGDEITCGDITLKKYHVLYAATGYVRKVDDGHANVFYSFAPGAVVNGQDTATITNYVPVWDSHGYWVEVPVEVQVPATNYLYASGDISQSTICNIQVLQTRYIALTSAQLHSFSVIQGNGSIGAATSGVYSLAGVNIEGAFDLCALDNGGTTLIGSDADGQFLFASMFGNDTLRAGNGNNDYLIAGFGVDTLIGGNGNDTFVGDVLADGSVIEGGGGDNVLQVDGDITQVSISNVQTLLTSNIMLTADQMNNFSSIKRNTYPSYATIIAVTGGVYSLAGKSTDPFNMIATSQEGTTLIGNDVNGGSLKASYLGNNTLRAGNGDNNILDARGSAGNNTLIAGDSDNNTLDAQYSAGNNTLITGNGDNNILDVKGSTGDNTLRCGDGNGNVLYAGAGNDTLIAGNGGDTLVGGGIIYNGNFIYSTNSLTSINTLIGGAGNDTFVVHSGAPAGTTIAGNGGDDTLEFGSKDMSQANISGIETLIETSSSSLKLTLDQFNEFSRLGVLGGASATAVDLKVFDAGTYDLSSKTILDGSKFNLDARESTGDVTLIGNDQDGQRLYAGAGNNTLIAGNGDGNVLNAQWSTGDNTLRCGDGKGNVLRAGAGNNTLIAGNGDGNVLDARWSTGDNTLRCGDGKGNVLYAGAGNNTLIAGNGDGNVLDARWSTGDNMLRCGDGKGNVLYAGAGNDTLIAGNGGDTLYGGLINDNGGTYYCEGGFTSINTLIGGDGDDTFHVFGAPEGTTITGNGGNDTLKFHGGDISHANISGVETFIQMYDSSLNLTLDQFNGFSNLGVYHNNDEPEVTVTLKVSDAGTYDLSSKTILEGLKLNLDARESTSNVTLIGNDQDGQELYAGAGNDTLIAGNGGATLYGGLINDNGNIYYCEDGFTSINTLIGGEGDDTFHVFGAPAGTTITGNGGNDTLKFDGRDISHANISGVETFIQMYDSSLNLTLDQFNGFSNLGVYHNNDEPEVTVTLKVSDAGTYDLSSKTILEGLKLNLDAHQASGPVTLIGNSAPQILCGGTGNDILQGNGGNDTYLFEPGGGHDVIDNQHSDSSQSVLLFNDIYISPDLVTVKRVNDDLVLSMKYTEDSVTVKNYFKSNEYQLECVKFSPYDILWDYQKILSLAQIDTTGDNTMTGDSGNNVLDGGEGNDILDGRGGADTLLGGPGDDTIIVNGAYDNTGTTIDGGTGTNTLQSIGADLSQLTFVNVQTLDVLSGNSTSLTAAQLNSVNNLIAEGGSATLQAANAGTYDLTNKTVVGTFNLQGSSGADILKGNAATMSIYGGAGNDTLYAGTNGTELHGGEGTNTLNGGAGNDTLYMEGTGDKVNGGAGNDTIEVNTSTLTGASIDGGTGTNVLKSNGQDISAATIKNVQTLDVGQNSSVTLTAAQLAGFRALTVGGDAAAMDMIYAANAGTYDLTNKTVVGTFNLQGSSGADILKGNAATMSIYGGAGNDTLYAGTNGTELHGGEGTNTLSGGAANDTLYMEGRGDKVNGGAGNDTIEVNTSTLSGAIIDGGTGTNVLKSNGQDISAATIKNVQTLDVGQNSSVTLTAAQLAGFRALTAGGDAAAVDTIYAARPGTYDLTNKTVVGTFNLQGSSGADILKGNAATMAIYGGAGNDMLYAGTNGTELHGGEGMNTLNGGAANDTLYMEGRGDKVNGGAGNDTIEVNTSTLTGASIDGGTGTNVLKSNGHDISAVTIRNMQTLDVGQNGSVTLTAAQLAGFRTLTAGGDAAAMDTICAVRPGTYDLTGKDLVGSFNIFGSKGNDTLDSGTSKKASLTGNGGYDVYKIGLNPEQEITINNYSVEGVTTARGKIDFLSGLSKSNLWFQQNGSDLTISVLGTGERIAVSDWYGSKPRAQVQSFNTADGYKLDSKLSQLVSAMAGYAATHSDFNPLTATQMPTDPMLQSTIASSWHR